MALNFPDSPTIGDEFTGGGFTWIWTGSTWNKVAAATGGGGTGFFLYTGASGFTNFVLPVPQPAGVYFISSELGDTTYDVYAIASNGTLVGNTTSDQLITSDEFDKVVVIGGTNADTLTFDTKTTAFTTSKSDINDGAPAFITSVSVSDPESFDDTTVVAGGNFATDVEVYFVGTDATDRAAKSIVRNSSSELVVTRPDNLVPDYAPYDVKIINPGIPLPTQAPTQHILSDAITAGAYPVWVTTSPLFWEQGTTISLTLVAADAEGSDIDYSIISGSLLPNMSLDGETGVITVSDDSGYATGDAASIVVRATDTAGNTADSSFDIFVNSVPVYSLYFDPFVNAGGLEKTLLFDMNL
jgi:hypothetical protein